MLWEAYRSLYLEIYHIAILGMRRARVRLVYRSTIYVRKAVTELFI